MTLQLTHRRMIRATEVWTLDGDTQRLRVTSGCYDGLDDFRVASEQSECGCGEGLAGRAWRTRSPQIAEWFDGEWFDGEAPRRAAEARSAGLERGVALPFCCGPHFRGVVTLLCGAPQVGVQGAFELWKPSDRRELGLTQSHYANLAPFGRLSQHVRFPRGAGLPGQVWQMRFPKIVDGLATAPSFMRAAGARSEGLQIGLGIPFLRSPWELDAVLLMLSSADSPVADAFEIWQRDDGERLTHHSGAYGARAGLQRLSATLALRPGEGVAGEVLRRGEPFATDDLRDWEASRADRLEGLTAAVGMPVFVGEALVAVVVMLSCAPT